MIELINSKDLKMNPDLICSYCGRNHNRRDLKGNLISQEGIDYIFERKEKEEWCICISCKKECDEKGLI